MAQPAKSRIPAGFPTITANITAHDAAKAIDFYKRALGAEEVDRAIAPDGKSVWHCDLRIGTAHLFVNDEMPAMGGKSAKTLGGSPVSMWMYVEDCDAAFKRALDAGAQTVMPVADMFWGDRSGTFVDPYGIRWTVATHKVDMTREEMQKAGEEFARKMKQQK